MKKRCLIISLTGILLLLFISNFAEPKTMEISSINEKNLNQQVKITGQVISKNNYTNNFTVLNLEDKTGKIQVICSCPNIKQNQTLEIIGAVEKYKDDLQINAEEIRGVS